MENGVLIQEYIEQPGMTQDRLAELLGCRQSYISQLLASVLASDREIYIIDDPDEGIVAREIRPIPNRKSA